MHELGQEVQLLLHSDLADDLLDQTRGLLHLFLLDPLFVEELAVFVAVEHLIVLVALNPVPFLIIHLKLFVQVDVKLVDDCLQAFADHARLLNFFFVNLLVALVQVLVFFIAFRFLQPRINEQLIELKRVFLEQRFNLADFAVDALVLFLVNVLVHLLDDLSSLAVKLLVHVLLLRVRARVLILALLRLRFLAKVLSVGILDAVTSLG